jgi:hypothetical protein
MASRAWIASTVGLAGAWLYALCSLDECREHVKLLRLREMYVKKPTCRFCASKGHTSRSCHD